MAKFIMLACAWFQLHSSCFTFNSTSLQELSASQQEQLQQRVAYLRQQRDKLHALKKDQQKPKQTTTPEETPTREETPTSTPVTTPLITRGQGHFGQWKNMA